MDDFYASLSASSLPRRVLSDRGFAKARQQLHLPALRWLNAELVEQADQRGLIARWCGLRVVAGDGSVLSPALCRCHTKRASMAADNRLFALFLPGAELLLHAELSSYCDCERAQLMRTLDCLSPSDVLVLDRGYPAHWLINALNARGIQCVMRCDAMGFAAVREFVRTDASEARVRLGKPRAADAKRWGVCADAPTLVIESIQQGVLFLQKQLDALQRQISDHIDRDPELREKRSLLLTIPGVGPRVAEHMSALLTRHPFTSAEQLAAYLGLVPVEWQSGSSIKGRPHLSKAGPAHLRRLLYLPALVASKYNPHVRATYERLISRGKSKMSALGAAMRKLAHLCFGVVHSKTPYRSDYSTR